MTGFIRNLFGSKKKAEPKAADSQSQPVEQPKPEKAAPAPKRESKRANKPKPDSQAFFLEPDDAKTFGNIEYMRTAKTVKRTFPKGKVTGEYVAEVSALQSRKMDQAPSKSLSNPLFDAPAREPDQSIPSSGSTSERRRADSSMDMFRKMAKDIKK